MDFSTGTRSIAVDDLGDDASTGLPIRGFDFDTPVSKRAPRQPAAAIISTDALPPALAANWVKLYSSQLSSKFYSRLLRLASDRFGASSRPTEKLRPTSLSDFLDFWIAVRDVASEPELAISKDGSIYVEWFKAKDRRLDMKFGDGVVLFGLFDRGRILEGAERKELVAAILRNHSSNPLQWRA